MPRGPRLDAPGILHHVRFRGIERRKIFVDDRDREDLLERLTGVCEDGRAFVYAWCMMSNHVHLAIRTGVRPLAKTIGGLLSGYATAFNLRHGRSGHLFQNRYKSTVVKARQVVAYLAVRKLGIAGAVVARSMNVSAPAITAASGKGEEAMGAGGLTVEGLLSGVIS